MCIPAPKDSKKSEEIREEKPSGKWVLTHQISLLLLEAQDLYNFLASHEDELQQIASAEEEDRRERLSKVYEILLKYSQDNNEDDSSPVVSKRVSPISIPEGKYLTVENWFILAISTHFLKKNGRPLVEIQE